MIARPLRLLDLFCGAGGAAMGYHRAGFEVVGVDIVGQKHYPFDFHQADALEYVTKHGGQFDIIHASPPCQGYSRLRHLPWLRGRTWPMLIPAVRECLTRFARVWVMENVEDAPCGHIVLCGQMFKLPIYRHRKFECSMVLLAPHHPRHETVIGHGRLVNDRRKGTLNAGSSRGAWGQSAVVTVVGGQFRKRDGEIALGINWMTCNELSQAIPPAYTEFIGRQLYRSIINHQSSIERT